MIFDSLADAVKLHLLDCPQSIIDEVQITSQFRLKGLYIVFTKWIAPVCIVIILVTPFLQAAGILVI